MHEEHREMPVKQGSGIRKSGKVFGQGQKTARANFQKVYRLILCKRFALVDVVEMAKAYSNDLRQKLLGAYDAGKGALAQLAAQFGVSVDWAYKISSARKRTGSMDRALQSRHGPPSKVDRAQVTRLLAVQPDLLLRELAVELRAATGTQVSPQQLCRVVRELGLRRKKSRSTPANGTRKKIGFDASNL
jgi:transposase